MADEHKNENSFDFCAEFEDMMHSRRLESVIILAHRNPDGDAAGSALGLAHYIRDVYPQFQVYPYLSEALDKGPKRVARADKAFPQVFACPPWQGLRYAAIVCDTATKERIVGAEIYQNAQATLVIDHHLMNEAYGDRNYTVPRESCAENIFSILDWGKWKRAQGDSDPAGGLGQEGHPNAVDYLYLGMLHDTNCFQRVGQGGTTFYAASKLMELGVDHKALVKTMHVETFEDLKKRHAILGRAKRVFDGKVAYVFLTKEDCESNHFEYEDIHPISGFLRDCDDIELAFTMFEEEPDLWRCSFRSDGEWINTNELLNPFGGGGHKGASGLRKKSKEPGKLIDEILKRVAEMKCIDGPDSMFRKESLT